MKFVKDFPRQVQEIENLWIPLPDGTRLAARAWMPVDAAEEPVPAILEMIPYRKRDGMARRDEMMHPYFAGHGYAAIRIDLRGSGDSEGLLDDEYAPQEQEDGLAIIDWLSRQRWCSGNVGMIGISWGGFNSLQVAARRPPALKAIVSVGSTDDRYADDVHFMGGCLLSAKFTWAQTLYSDLTRPPDPAIVGDRWQDMWLDRLRNEPQFLARWLEHQTRDDYWRHGSVCEDYGAIECAVFAVGGWADSYSNPVARLVSNLKAPSIALIGPWGHDYPHTAVPGPAIGFLQECLRWWDHWLKGKDSGIMHEPKFRIWVQEKIAHTPDHTARPGHWVGLRKWPDQFSTFYLGQSGLSSDPQPAEVLTHGSPQTLGSAAGEWCSYGACADQPADQAGDDGRALVFDSAPLKSPLSILGTTVLDLSLSIDRPLGFLAVRLEDVDPSGRSARISYGLLNIAHREGHDRVTPAVPGEMMRVRVKLCDTAYVFAPGHRIRVAVSTAYWPTVWPSPEAVTLSIETAGCALRLPVASAGEAGAIHFTEAEAPAPVARAVVEPPENRRELRRNYITGEEIMEVVVDDGLLRIETHGLAVGRRCVERYVIHPDDPLSALCEADWTMRVERGDWKTRTETRATMRADKDSFHIRVGVQAFLNGSLVFSREDEQSIPRDGI